MILAALQQYYQRLENDPKSGVIPAGYSRQKIAFRVNLRPDGTLVGIEPLGEVKGKKRTPELMVVPGQTKKPGVGMNPGFLWDNGGYMLGYKPDDTNPKRTLKTFAAFGDRHVALEDELNDEGFSAVVRFLETWVPSDANRLCPELADVAHGFGVFHLVGEKQHVHERPAVKTWWESGAEDQNSGGGIAQCLVTGEVGPIARTHEPEIKGVLGAKSKGAVLVGFNLKSTESYGREQGANAPVGEAAAFQYAVALNRLLDRDGGRRVQVGDATVVFWTERPSPAENFLGLALDPPTEDDETAGQVAAALAALKSGECPPEWGDPATLFYLLGLSPNAARLSVRFWTQGTLGELVRNAHRHFADLKIIRPRNDKEPELPSLWRLQIQTARETKEISPLLSAGLLSALLNGAPYPRAFLAALVRRTRADRDVRGVRAGALKACLNREFRARRSSPLAKELPVALDPDRPEPAYHLGRLFAALEKVQSDAFPNVNATIKDRYFGAASATPASVFPRLVRMSQHHAAKLENAGHKVAHERRVQEIVGRLDGFPRHLPLPDQGLFAVGYYHQRQDLFLSKADREAAAETAVAAD
ncbi:type I-C CRISPR-associated protein Cas8c/Csd1 [Alienimonas californiensis]|uniref:CRISPR-associated protein (Cas_Csd1) n=1 Tax=Alienimonas californiensis TaxID=2527989 RepID=A0A517PAL5_9PLAN|nr:type I-C CRISPR-associated protein Cas8c/Csd1 [Alienimonas californiensis]QDT16413.1 CRISPR-associated protein (Cas_Csd1) [Alienimonas californiensis]